MSFLHNISTVSKYEARTLRRSWFFRLFSLGAFFIFTILNIGVFSPVGEGDWAEISIPSALPLINLYLLNIGQAIVVIFLAADFLKRDKKLDTNEVLYTRSMSNFEYVIGKTWGILRLFLGLNIIILSIGLIVNIINTKMTVDISSYFAYLLIISVPTLLFSLGLAFLMMSLIRNQALTFLLLLGIAVLDMFYLWFRMGSIFDYMAFGLPVFKSGLIGFDNIEQIVSQRLFFFSLGAAFVFGTILLFKRLPQSKLHTAVATILLVLFSITAAIGGWKTYSIYDKKNSARDLVIETNRKFEERKFADVTKAVIDIDHQGKIIVGKAELTIRNNNNEALESYLFSLNPELITVSAKTISGNSEYANTNHVIEIKPEKPLGPGETDSVLIEYSGRINESFCYPDYSDNLKDNAYRIAMVNINKRQAFLDDEYVLLTPDSHWYPVASLNYYPSNPARIKVDFSMYTLRVKNEPGLTAISQGRREKTSTHSIFIPENPMSGITLAIGNYIIDSLKVDSVEYFACYFPEHDYYKKDLSELKDTLPAMISGIMRELETNFSTPFPFKTLTLVEVPVQFYSYPRQNTQTRAEVQPSMVLLPEKLSTLRNAGFAERFTQQKKSMARNNQVITDKELQVRILNSFIRNTFISGQDFRFVNGTAVNEPVRYRLGPSFYFFKNNFYSSEYPVINAVFESHLQKVEDPGQSGFYISDALSDNDKANLILKNITFSELLRKNPQGDTIRTVVTVKADWFFNLLRSRAGTEQFNDWFRKYLDDNKFKKINLTTFDHDINQEFGFEFYSLLNNWFNGKDQPGFMIENLRVTEIVVNDRSRYQVTFTIMNPEPVAGLFNVSFRTGQGPQTLTAYGQRSAVTVSTQGRGMETDDISKIVYMGPLEARYIGALLDYQPRTMVVNTLFSKNIPGLMSLPIDETIKSRGNIKPFEGEEVLQKLPNRYDASEIIVDNEDPGFNSGNMIDQGPLKRLFKINKRSGETYETVRTVWVPETWQPVIQSNYYGKYVLSAIYTRPSNTAERSVSWTTPIKDAGFYDIYTYIGKSSDRVTVRRGGPEGAPPPPGANEESAYRDMHYKIYHDQGVEEITVDYENAEGGWNNLGRYYLSGDTARIELTNQSQGKVVIGDAVKWVRQD